VAKAKEKETIETPEVQEVSFVKGLVKQSFAAGEDVFQHGEKYDFEAETAKAFVDGGLIEIVKG
jgi:hypothetical protein